MLECFIVIAPTKQDVFILVLSISAGALKLIWLLSKINQIIFILKLIFILSLMLLSTCAQISYLVETGVFFSKYNKTEIYIVSMLRFHLL